MCLEIIRVTQQRSQWTKNCIPVSFPTVGISIPGSMKTYRVIGTCHHQGSLKFGHWFTKVITNANKWFKLDDLRGNSSVTSSPGMKDSTVVILVLVAEGLVSN